MMRLGLSGCGRQTYGSFAGRAPDASLYSPISVETLLETQRTVEIAMEALLNYDVKLTAATSLDVMLRV